MAKPVGFTRADAGRIAEATKHYERTYRGEGPGRGVPPAVGRGLRLAKAPAGGILGKSGTTPDSKFCLLYEWNGTALDTGSEQIEVFNSYSSAVGVSKDLWIVRWAGAWWVLTEAC